MIMKTCIFIIVLLGCQTNVLIAQSTWFITFDPEIAVQNTVGEIVEMDGAYYVSLFAANSFVPVNQSAVMKFSSAGQHEWTTLARYPSSADSFTTSFNLLPGKDTSIFFLSSAKTWDTPNRILINKFKPDGSIAWDKTIALNDGGKVYTNFNGNALGPDSLYMILARATPSVEMAIFCVDTAGNNLWQNRFSPQTNYSINDLLSVVVAPDSAIYIAYYNSIISAQTKDYVVKCDPHGTPLKYYLNPQPDFSDFPAHLAWHPNGNLVYLSHRSFPSGQGGADPYGGMRVQMLTPDLDTIWTYLFYELTVPYGLFRTNTSRHLSIAPDGKILASATANNYMHLVCFSPEGDVLWWRELALEGEVDPGYRLKHFNTAVWTSDGGILANGYMYGTIDMAYKSKIFLMKLDSVGCLEPGCDQTVITDVQEATSLSDDCWSVSPNPATDVVRVRFSPECPQARWVDRVLLFDLHGRLVYEHPLEGSLEVSIPTTSLPAGVYFLQAGDGRLVRLSRRLVVGR